MKRLIFGLAVFTAAVISQVHASDSYRVIQRSQDCRILERTEYEIAGDGQRRARVHRYTELATGLSYWDEDQWKDSLELVESAPGGAIAAHGNHKVSFANNLADPGAIDLQMPGGEHLRSTIIGLAYFDTSTGQSVLIAEVKDCQGRIVSPNQVLYEDAFTSDDGIVQASVQYTYTRAGFEQDILLASQLPEPSIYGLNGQTAVLQVLTEFFSPPQPAKAARALRFDAGAGVQDEELDFGAMRFVRGKAFSVGGQGQGSDVPVARQWLKLDNRDVLVEQVSLSALQPQLNTLPKSEGASLNSVPATVRHTASLERILPPRRVQSPGAHPSASMDKVGEDRRTEGAAAPAMQLASLKRGGPCVVIDYAATMSTTSNYLFAGDMTYFVSGPVYLSGPTNTFEAGTVIKYGAGASLNVSGVNCLGEPYRPVIFTAKDDDSVGEQIANSTGNPGSSYYANPAISYAGGSLALSNFRIVYANTAVYATGQDLWVSLLNGQIVNCRIGFATDGQALVRLQNSLFARVSAALNLSLANVQAQHVTFDGNYPAAPNYAPAYLVAPVDMSRTNTISVNLVNCIVANFSQFSPLGISITGDHNGFFNTPPAFGTLFIVTNLTPFHTAVGAGNYYLADGCVFRDAGTTNIDPALAIALMNKTTYPPECHTNEIHSNGLTWGPRAQRDTDLPDLGYHYEPLDYLCCQVTQSGSSLVLTNGVAVGGFGTAGFVIGAPGAGGAGFKSVGRPDALNHLIWYPSVQEQPVKLGGVSTSGSAIFSLTGPGMPRSVNLRFTDLPMQGRRQALLYSPFAFDYPGLELHDCWLRGVNLSIPSYLGDGSPGPLLALQNNLLQRSTVCLFNGYLTAIDNPPTYVQNPLMVTLCNNLFWNSSLSLTYQAAHDAYQMSWTIKDNLFDGCSVSFTGDGVYASHVDKSNNAGFNTPMPAILTDNATNVQLTNLIYAVGPLGPWYIGAASPSLTDAGSRRADQAGLYHYTIQTNQMKEANSQVDIGYHYVAVEVGGKPIDSDGDGTADYLEDGNGNGLTDLMESTWSVAIVRQPQDQAVCMGDNVTFNVAVAGQMPLSYQWYDGACAITNATNAVLCMTNTQASSAGIYSVVVSNLWGCVISSNAVLTVNPPLRIVSQPVSQVVSLGAAVGFSVVAASTRPIAYQWRRNGTNIPLATQRSYVISSAQTTNTGSYSVVVSNALAVVLSANAQLVVTCAPPRITLQPESLTVTRGNNARFDIAATGANPLSYQWRYNGLRIPGATLKSYVIGNAQSADVGDYTVVITNMGGCVTSSIAALVVNVPPVITSQPVSITVNEGDSATFSVGAAGTAPLFYQWMLNDIPIPGANQSVYTLTNVSPQSISNSIAGVNVGYISPALSDSLSSYYVIVTNAAGRTISSNVTLTVNFAPAISEQPASVVADVGSDASFTVKVTGTEPLSYQWSSNGVPIVGATKSTYTLTIVDQESTGAFAVLVTNALGSVASSNAMLIPNSIHFSLDIGNQHFKTLIVTGAFTGVTGMPAFWTVSTNVLFGGSNIFDTNVVLNTDTTAIRDDAPGQWYPYSGTFAFPIGSGDGEYQLAFGLKGPGAAAKPVWVNTTVIIDTTPPGLFVTNPICSGSIFKPYVQIQGYSDEELSTVEGLVTNSAAGCRKLAGYITAVSGDTNGSSFEFPDILLGDGTNQITITITDLTGNQATTNLDYVRCSNAPPANVRVDWPASGTTVALDTLTIQGHVSDETCSLYLFDSLSNRIDGLVERNGTFWVTNVPLCPGTNNFALLTTNWVGLSSQTNLVVIKAQPGSSDAITIQGVSGDNNWDMAVTVNGTAGPGRQLMVNGIAVTADASGNWSVAVPVPRGGTAVYTATGPASGGNGMASGILCVSKPARVKTAALSRYMANVAVDPRAYYLPYLFFHLSPSAYSSRIFNWNSRSGGFYDLCSRSHLASGRVEFAHCQFQFGAELIPLHWIVYYQVDDEFNDYKDFTPDRSYLMGFVGDLFSSWPRRGALGVSSGYCSERIFDWWSIPLVAERELATAKVVLQTGGKSGCGGTRRLYLIQGQANEITVPCSCYYVSAGAGLDFGFTRRTEGIPPTLLRVAGLGKALNSEGKLYAVLPDNMEVDVTLMAPRPYYEFNVSAEVVADALTLNCPGDLNVPPDYIPALKTFTNGAVVTYSAPRQAVPFDSIEFDPPSGTFLKVGTHTVFCKGLIDGQTVATCSFQVSVSMDVISTGHLRMLPYVDRLVACQGESLALTEDMFFDAAARNGQSITSYQWKHNGQLISQGNKTSYTLGNSSFDDSGTYVLLADGYQSMPIWVDVITTNLVITAQPQGGTVEEGQAKTFQVAGLPDGVTYVWFKDGVPISNERMAGVNSATLTIDPVSREDSGAYWVIVSTPCASISSSPAILTVCYRDWTNANPIPVGNLASMANVVISASSQVDAVSNAFDGVFCSNAQTWTNCWCPQWAGGEWLRVDLPSAKLFSSYDIFIAAPTGVFSNAGPAELSWSLRGSPDGTNWTTLHLGSISAPWTNGVKKSFAFGNTNTGFSHYQVAHFGVWSNGVPLTNDVGISELRFYEGETVLLGSACGKEIVVTTPANSTPPVISLRTNLLVISNSIVVTNQVAVTDEDSAADEVILSATSSDTNVVPLVSRTFATQTCPSSSQYAVEAVAAWGYSGTSVITLCASNTTPPYLTCTTNFQVVANPSPSYSNGTRRRLGYWRFNDSPDWRDEGSLAPSAMRGLMPVPSWSGDAVSINAAQQGLLEYPGRRGTAPTNSSTIAFDSGTIRFWFKPDWGGVTSSGAGPGKKVRLFEAGREISDSWILGVSDVTNSTSFINKLLEPTNAIAWFLKTNLSETTDLSRALHNASAFKEVIKDVNVMLMEQCIYDLAIFTNIQLRLETTALLARAPVGEDLVRLNRMLLEDAFPSDIKAKPTAPSGAFPGWMAMSVNSHGTMVALDTQSGFSHIQQVRAFAPMPAHQWCQVVLTCETNASKEIYRLYFNGQLLGSNQTALDTALVSSLQAQNVFRVGCAWNGEDQAEGAFDELETFNYPLTPDEITANYNQVASVDTDGDGLPDLFENGIGTNPLAMDTDCDGLPDGWEFTHGYNPSDFDDGTSQALQAYQLELLRPERTNSATPVVQIRPGRNAAYLTWDGVAGAVTYTVYRSTSFTGNFTQVGVMAGNRAFADDEAPLEAGRTYYYRVDCLAAAPKTGSPTNTAHILSSDIVSVAPFGCASNPAPYLSYIKTLSIPSLNGSYVVSFQTLRTNSALVNIGGRPLVYVVDQVVSGSLLINGAPFGPGNHIINNNCPAVWTPPAGGLDTNAAAFRVYVSDGIQRFERTVDVQIVLQPKRCVFGWGYNEAGQLGNGHYADTYVYFHTEGYYISDYNSRISYFSWCNGSKSIPGTWCGQPWSFPYDSATISNYTIWESQNGVIPFDARWGTYTNEEHYVSGSMVYTYNKEYALWELSPTRILELPSNVRSIGFGAGEYPAFDWWDETCSQAYAVTDDGSLWQWGKDKTGLFGKVYSFAQTNCSNSINLPGKAIAWSNSVPNTWTNRGTPLPVLTLPTAYRVPDWTNGGERAFGGIAAAAGDVDWRAVLKTDGTLWSWGNGLYLGREVDTNQPSVLFPSGWFGYRYWEVDNALPIDYAPGRITIPGNDWNGIQPGRKFVELRSGMHNAIARCEDGSVWWWGEMAYLNLEYPAEGWFWSRAIVTNSIELVPFVTPDPAHPHAPVCLTNLACPGSENNPIVQMSASDSHYIFLRADGSVFDFGYVPILGDWGTCNGFQTNQPVPVAFPKGVAIISVQAGSHYGIALDEQGQLWVWGWMNLELIPTPRLTPLQNIVKAVCSGETILALDRRGDIWGWGHTYNLGLLQTDPNSYSSSQNFKTKPVRINGVENVSDIFSGGFSAFAVGESEEGKPTRLTAAGLDQQVRLGWAPYPGAGQYDVYRSLDPDEGYVVIGTAANNAYLDGLTTQVSGQNARELVPLVNGQTYYYKVAAVINGIESAKSREVEASPQPKPSVVPSLLLTNRCRSVSLAWSISTNAAESHPLEYRVERTVGSNTVFEPIAHCAPDWGTSPTTLQFEDSQVMTNTGYSYRVVALNDAGISLPSIVVSNFTGLGNCQEAPELIGPSCSAQVETITLTYDDGVNYDSTADNNDSLLLGDADEGDISSQGSTSAYNPGADVMAIGAAYLVWTYPTNLCADVSVFRIRYHYIEHGRASGGDCIQDIPTNSPDLQLQSSWNGTNTYQYRQEFQMQKPCSFSVSAIWAGEETRSSAEVMLVAEDSAWKISPRAIPGYQQVYVDWQESDLIYSYGIECSAQLPYAGMGEETFVTLGSDMMDCRFWHTDLTSSNFTSTDIIDVSELATRLVNADTNDAVAQLVWSHFSTAGQESVRNYALSSSSHTSQQILTVRQTLVDELNAMIHGGSKLFTLDQMGMTTNGDISTRTRLALDRQAQSAASGIPFTSNDIAELNRFLLEDTFVAQIARHQELEPQEFVSADIKACEVGNLIAWLKEGSVSNAISLSNAMRATIDFSKLTESIGGANQELQEIRRTLAIGLTAAIQSTNLPLQCDTNGYPARTVELFSRRGHLSTNEVALLNRLLVQELYRNCFEPLTGLRYYSICGMGCNSDFGRNPKWVAAQPLDTGTNLTKLTFSAQAFPYSSMILVQWNVPGSTNYVPGADGGWQFYVERKSGAQPYSLLTSAGFGLAYLDTDVVNGQTYTYRVTAFDQYFNRYQSETNATPNYADGLTLLPPAAGNAYVDLSWTPVRAASFDVGHSLNPGGPFDTVATLGNNGDAYQNADSHYRHQSIQNGVPHYYRIRAITPTGYELFSNTNSAVPLATLPPLPPNKFDASLTMSPDGVSARVLLKWSSRSGADRYQVLIRQAGALTPLYEGRAFSCTYDIPPDLPENSTLIFAIRCVASDGRGGELKELTTIYKKTIDSNQAGEPPKVQLKVAGVLASDLADDLEVIAPTNLTLGVANSIPILRVSFFDECGGCKRLIGVADSPPYALTWTQPQGGDHTLTASAEVNTADNPATSTRVAILNTDPAYVHVIVKPELSAYNTSATDLQLSAMGLSITLGRSYSSHNTASDLLGVGWVTAWTGGSLKFSADVSDGWIGATSRFLDSIPVYSVGELSPHEATVTLPGGQIVPFWVGVQGQQNYDDPSLDDEGLSCQLVLGAYDPNQGTLTCLDGRSRVDALATNSQAVQWGGSDVGLSQSASALAPFTYVSPDGTSYLFAKQSDDLTWLLTRVTDRNGNWLEYNYGDGSADRPTNQLVAITHSGGRGIKLTYTNTGGNSTNISVFDAVSTNVPVITYVVCNGQLTEVRRLADRGNPGSMEVTRYIYGTGNDDTNRLIEVYDPRGVRVMANSYMSAANDETSGNLLCQTNIVNAVTHYSLSTNGELTVIQTVGGVSRVINVVHDDSGAIIGATQPADVTNASSTLTVTNTYDDRGRLIAQRNALGGLKTYAYDDQDRLVGQSDELGNSTSSELNTFGEPTASTDANGNSTVSHYDDQGNPTRVEDPGGTVTLYDYAESMTTSSGRVLGKRVRRETRNAPGVPYTLVTENAYVGEDGDSSSPSVGDLKSVTQKAIVTDESGAVLVFGGPITVSYEYDVNGNRTREIKTRNVGSGPSVPRESITNETTYDAQNRVLTNRVFSSLDGLLQTSSGTYNSLGKQVTTVDAAGRTTTNTYDFAGNLIQTAYPDGTVTRTAYDLEGRPQYVQERAVPDGLSTTAPATRTTYDASGRAVKVERLAGVTLILYPAHAGYDYVGAPDGMPAMGAMVSAACLQTITRTYYDELGRVQYSVDARTNVTESLYDSAGRRTSNLVYFASSNLIGSISDSADAAYITSALTGVAPDQCTTYTYDPNGNQLTVTDSLNRTTTSVYDNANRLVRTDFPDAGQGLRSHLTQYDGLGQRVQETDENGVITKYQYDFRGLLTSVTLAGETAEAVTTVYQYDELGNLVKQTDANNHSTIFAYDALGRRIRRTLPENQSEGFAYDASGNLIYHTNFNRVVITNQYDFANRLTNRATPGGYNVSFAYSATGQRTRMTQRSATDGQILQETRYGYNNLNLLESKEVDSRTRSQMSVIWGPVPVTNWLVEIRSDVFNYAYDATGTLTGIGITTGDLGYQAAYTYDSLGRLTNVTANGVQAASYGFDTVGNLQYTRFGNGVTNLYQYDARNRLTNLVWKAGSSPLASFAYQLGATGMRTNLAETISGVNRTYNWSYDRLSRLTGEAISGSPLASFGYAFDPVGNRTNRTSTFNGLTNQSPTYSVNDLLSSDSYDSNGNTTLSASVAYQYDAENHLTNVNNGAVVMTYDGDGNRISKTANGVTTYYLVDDHNPSGYAQVLAEYTYQSGGGMSWTRTYVYGLALVSQAAGGGTNYYGTDGHGSTRFLTDSTGVVTDTYTYDAYGNLIDRSGALTPNNYLYCGEQFDSDLGLYYLRARYYKPEMGRFWTMDTYEGNQEDPQSLHRYLYCADNPPNLTDPSGHEYTYVSMMGTMSLMVEVELMHLHASANATRKAQMISGSVNPDFNDLIWGLEAADIIMDKVQLAMAAYGMTYATVKVATFLSENAYSFGNATIRTLDELREFASHPSAYRSYAEIRNAIKEAGMSTVFDSHHLLAKVFAPKLGLNPDEIMAVPLVKNAHTNKGGGGINIYQQTVQALKDMQTTVSGASVEQIWKAHKSVYEAMGHPEWAKALHEAYFKSRGIAY